MMNSWKQQLEQVRYIVHDDLETMVSLSVGLGRPLLVEGPAGVGKTALAYALASVLARPVVRLQCFEGMDAAHALYDWNYHKQLAYLSRTEGTSEANVFSDDFILPRPLMQALRMEQGAVLLIDEIDRADEAFEALLLEFLAEFQISVPEWGTVKAQVQPVVVLTSNRTRPLSDALRRRCLYAHVPWPTEALEREIVTLHVPELGEEAVCQLVRATRMLRSWELLKSPGVAETIDWARAYVLSGEHGWNLDFVRKTLGCVIKDAIDMQTVRQRVLELAEP